MALRQAVVPALTLILGASLISSAWCRPSQQVPIGPRPIAMGGAFGAVADDISAIFWNPAGLSRVGHQEITGTYADLYDSGLKDSYTAFLIPLSDRHAAAVDWYHSGFHDSELDFGENRFDLSYGLRLQRRLFLGMNLKYLTRNTGLDGTTVRSGSAPGLDAGALFVPRPGLRFGVVGQDLFDTRLDYDNGTSTVVYPRTVRVGASFDPRPDVTLALDMDDRYHVGTEVRPHRAVALRGGYQEDRVGGDGATWSVGAGLTAGIFRFDYAYVMPPTLSATSHVGLSLAFNFNPSQIRIEKVEVEDLHASLYKRYVATPVGKVRLRNLQDRPLTTKLSVFVPGTMDAPSEEQVVVRPQAVLDVPIHALFSGRIMERGDDRAVNVQVSATYQSQRLSRTERKSGRAFLYGPGAIDWSHGVGQAAAFVTAKDPVVDEVARQAVRLATTADADFGGNRNLRSAAAVFDALGVMGIAYVPDPENPFSSVSETARAVDTIHYPRETLDRRAGDCDDTTVLYAALLANVGVPSQFVDVPGHLFLLVDTGVHERNRLAIGLDESLYVISGDGVWIPVETTALGKGFAEAWRTGAEEYRSWEGRRQLQCVDVASAQADFPPGELMTPLPAIAPADTARLRERIVDDARVLAGKRDEYLASRYGDLRNDRQESLAALNEIAQVYFAAGRFVEARGKLQDMLRQDPESPAALNNLGNVHAALGETEAAIERYRQAAGRDPGDGGTWLNLGLACYARGDTLGGRAGIRRGIEAGGGYEKACDLLGIPVSDPGMRAGAPRLTEAEIRQLLLNAAGAVPDSSVAADTLGTRLRTEPPVPPRPMAVRVAGSRATGISDLRAYLYWKPEGARR